MHPGERLVHGAVPCHASIGPISRRGRARTGIVALLFGNQDARKPSTFPVFVGTTGDKMIVIFHWTDVKNFLDDRPRICSLR
jgi:hypothetical protein